MIANSASIIKSRLSSQPAAVVQMQRSQLLIGILLLIMVVAPSANGSAQELEHAKSPRTIPALRKAIVEVMQQTGTPAAGIALVTNEGPVWVEGMGLADSERGIAANDETLFRIGSTSKIFVAMALLKLQEQGSLRLQDRVAELVPEIAFTNPWEKNHPLLVAHLLEHTTGWDEIHLPELIHNDSSAIPLKKALALHPHSRVSKWVPGTRMAYSNAGPAVAAYIVEKVTGQPYETYIQSAFFDPMGMESMTFFRSNAYRQKGAVLYKEGEAVPYWHLLFRPSGAINASARDMAKLLHFFIQRGVVNGTKVLSEHSLKRMETPSTTLGARAGLSWGYGLGLYTSDHKGFTYYKHGGSIGAGKSDFSYLPEAGVGYAVLINADNTEAIRKISSLIRDYQTQQLPRPDKGVLLADTSSAPSIRNGYYEPINPIKQLPFYLPPLLVERIWTEGDTVYNQIPAHLGTPVKFVKTKGGAYHNLLTNRPDLVVVTDPLAGEVLELAGMESGTVTLGRVSGLWVFGRILVLLLWLLFMLRAFLILPLLAYRYWKGQIRRKAALQVRLWPLVPVACLVVVVGLLAAGSLDGKESLAQPSYISVSVMLGTIAFLVTAVIAFVEVIRHRNNGIKKATWYPAILLAGSHLLVACYLLAHGVIGLMTWA